MKTRAFFQFMLFGLIVLILVSVIAAFAAGMNIESSNIEKISFSVSADDLKPPACTMHLTAIRRGSGVILGSSGNDLILGSSGNDTIDGAGGDDCILGDSGNDNITGSDGDDHIIGGNGTDICTGGPGANSFDTCETVNDP